MTMAVHPKHEDLAKSLTAHLLSGMRDAFRARFDGVEAEAALTPDQWEWFNRVAREGALTATHGLVEVFSAYHHTLRKRERRKGVTKKKVKKK